MRAVYLNTEDENDIKGSVKVVDVDTNIDTMYDMLHCSTIDIAARRIGGRQFLIVCDDEGRFVSSPKISACDEFGHVMLVGSLLIFAPNEQRFRDESSDYRDMTDEEVSCVLDSVCTGKVVSYPNGLRMIVGMEY